MLRNIRIILAALLFLGATLLFLDFTGTIHSWLGWIAKIQFLPAVLALNVVVIVGLIALTLVFGRIYCSVICPLGVMQDVFGRLGKLAKKNRYSFSPAKNILRYTFLGVMVLSIVFGVASITALLAPYSAYGRIAQTLMSPLWIWINNFFAHVAERMDSYMFYDREIWLRSGLVLGVAIATLLVLGILAWRNGRTYCNTVCPVGTVLGFVAKFSVFKPVIDTSKCNGCGLCARNCKAACIDSKQHRIDYSRCVACMDCIDKCHKNAISYALRRQAVSSSTPESESRRSFLSVATVLTAGTVIHAQTAKVDGGLAVIQDKKIPNRKARIVPPGAQSHRNIERHCTGCQLCVAACPNHVLRPSADLERAFQPECSYERGYCRPECTKCSEVCPTGAIRSLDTAQKSATQIGHAVWIKENCVPLTDGVECGNCARHCPTGAIQMVEHAEAEGKKIPAVDTERCIGCGACENLCPARPFSAIYVEGHERHRIV